METPRPRFAPGLEFPPYTYVPGRAPHPVTDPRGHMFATTAEPVERPDALPRCRTFLAGIDLFNHGYYWEAHEAWERLWIAAGRAGRMADFLKGLIKLAAAGVKVREGNRRGAERHLTRAAQLFAEVMETTAESSGAELGLNPGVLLEWARKPAPEGQHAREEAMPVFDFVLTPAE